MLRYDDRPTPLVCVCEYPIVEPVLLWGFVHPPDAYQCYKCGRALLGDRQPRDRADGGWDMALQHVTDSIR